MKDRTKRNYRCLYCGYVSCNLDEVKKHEEYLHGCYRDINPRIPKSKKSSRPILKNSIWFARHLKLHNVDFKIDVLYEIYSDSSYRMFTDDLKYGPRQEIIFDNNTQMFTIKDIDKLREECYRNLGEDVITDVDSLERFKDEMS